jgi:hypothetical protein
MTNRYYHLWEKIGHADTDYDWDFFYGLSRGQGVLTEVPDITWTWRPMKGKEGTPPTDFPRTTVSCSLHSQRMREVIDQHLGTNDQLQWIPSTLRHGDGQEERYWILHFPHTPDVLNMELSTWGENGVPMRWVIQEDKLAGHEFFPACRNIIVSHRLVTALRKAGITGINPKRVRMDC